MIDSGSLCHDLHGYVQAFIDDLRTRLAAEADGGALMSEYEDARHARRTSVTWTAWRDERLTQAAVAWILGTVFVRFSEDNGLVAEPWLAANSVESMDLVVRRHSEAVEPLQAQTDADWLLSVFNALGSVPAASSLFDCSHNPLYQIRVSPEAATALITFWRRRDQHGRLIHDFTDPALDTRFLADLYQGLSESARRTHALVQTPGFVVDLILDQVLGAALEEFGYDEIRVIDPVCGSGKFVLGAFERLVRELRLRAPKLDPQQRVRQALRAVHGVDLNPFAVLITRFRLLVAALRASGSPTFEAMSDGRWVLNIAAGDSLLAARDDGEHGGAALGYFASATEDIQQHADMLGRGRYHVVVGNPPYVTVKDRNLDEAYRGRYDTCMGAYSLVVPFAQLFFELAQRGNGEGRAAGYVGYLTANHFMKREFGRRLVEEFLATRVTLSAVIDTSGAYIPGHGPPTIILVGRNRAPHPGENVLAVVGRRGEPAVPADPALGHVWQSILRNIGQSGQSDEWTQSVQLHRNRLASFPWNLAAAETGDLLARMSGAQTLAERVARIGYFANTGSDDLFIAPSHVFRRRRVEDHEFLIGVIAGSDVRDWVAMPGRDAFLPKAEGMRHPVDARRFPRHLERLWPYRTVLGRRPNYTARSYFDDGRAWYDWHHITPGLDKHPWSITFAWVATHNHFALVRDRVATLPSAPVVKLFKEATEQEHVGLLALLNSSAVCFWLKQVSNSKGRPTADQTGTGERWTEVYEFTASRLGGLPLPALLPTQRGARMELFAQELAMAAPAAVAASGPPTAERLAEASERWHDRRAWIVAEQEELDWEVYGLYGLIPDIASMLAPSESVPPLSPGQRAFEIVLARRAANRQESTTWFARNGLTPITEVPTCWPAAYRETVRRRIAAIENDADLAVLERPEFKRRWSGDGWDREREAALRTWLLDQCEEPELWFEDYEGARRPRPLTIAQLADILQESPAVAAAADAYAPDATLAELLEDVVAHEYVPAAAALRYRESGLLKRAAWQDVWRGQREEDAARRAGEAYTADGIRDSISIPPKYTSADFLKTSYWRQRGKYDVPNERFISYFHPRPSENPDLVIGWAGWTPAEQADVLTELVKESMRDGDYDLFRMIPLLAGLREVIPWVVPSGSQSGGEPSNQVRAYGEILKNYLAQLRISEDELSSWHPPTPRRGRPKKNA